MAAPILVCEGVTKAYGGLVAVSDLSFTGGASFRVHAALSYPLEVDDPARGQPFLVYQVQGNQQVPIWSSPWREGMFKAPPWLGA